MIRYKRYLLGAAQFVVMYGDPLDTMVLLEGPYRGWHGDPWQSELLFLDGHAACQKTETARGFTQRNQEWTLWFSQYVFYLPTEFVFPYPGIDVYVNPYYP
jgi:hypothetical protein